MLYLQLHVASFTTQRKENLYGWFSINKFVQMFHQHSGMASQNLLCVFKSGQCLHDSPFPWRQGIIFMSCYIVPFPSRHVQQKGLCCPIFNVLGHAFNCRRWWNSRKLNIVRYNVLRRYVLIWYTLVETYVRFVPFFQPPFIINHCSLCYYIWFRFCFPLDLW